MSEERNVSSSMKPRTDHRAVGAGAGVAVGVGAEARSVANIRASSTLMKSVSIFLMSGRKASVDSRKLTSDVPKRESRRRHRARMPDGGSGTRNSTHTVKLIESLRKKTRFSWQVDHVAAAMLRILRN